MLIIGMGSGGHFKVTFSELKNYNIPAPPNGFDSEINDNIVMKFDDEQQAIDYAHHLDVYADSINHHSPEYLAITKITRAISNDGFVQTYIQE